MYILTIPVTWEMLFFWTQRWEGIWGQLCTSQVSLRGLHPWQRETSPERYHALGWELDFHTMKR